MTNHLDVEENLHHLNKVCHEYCMSGSEVYGILRSKNDERFPLSYETIKYMVLKEVSSEILQKIFTRDELQNILENTNMRKIKNLETKKFINSILGS